MQRIYGTAFFKEDELKQHLHPDRGSQEARPPASSARDLGLFMFHPWAPGAAFWLGKGTTLYHHARQLHARGAVPRRLRRGEDAAHLQQGAVGNVRALAALPRRTCSSSNPKTSQMGVKADELPRPHARCSRARCAATATCRSGSTSRRRCIATRRRACSSGLTRVRQFSQDDAHCFVMESQIGDEVERLLKLVHARLRRLRAALRGQAVDPARRVSWARWRPGTTPKTSSSAALEAAGRGLYGQ